MLSKTSVRRAIRRTGPALAVFAVVTAAASASAATAPETSSSGAAAAAVPASGEAEPKKPAITGSGHIYFDDEQDREFTFNASGLAVDGYPPEGVPGTTGTFSVAHYTDRSHESGAIFSGHIDCLLVGGRTATFTGVVDDAISFGEDAPDVSALEGVRRGFSVYDSGPGRPDRLGFSWFMDPGNTTSSQKCQGPAPFAYVDKGDFQTTEWLPPGTIPPGSH